MEQERNYCVYKHTTPSGKVYIGLTGKDPSTRWNNGNGYNTQTFGHAVKKYGWNNIKSEILETNLTREEASTKEVDYILKYQSNDSCYGYNLTNGGELYFKLNDEAELRRKQSMSETGAYTLDYKLAKEIRCLYQSSDLSGEQIAKLYNVSRHAINNVVANRTWCDENYINIREQKYLEQVKEVRHLYQSDYSLTQVDIASMYNMNKDTLHLILKNVNYYDETYKNNREEENIKLNEEIVSEIRSIFDVNKHTYAGLGREYGVAPNTMKAVIQNTTWVDNDYQVPKLKKVMNYNKAEQIRSVYKKGELYMREVAELFNTSLTTVCQIVNNNVWTE